MIQQNAPVALVSVVLLDVAVHHQIPSDPTRISGRSASRPFPGSWVLTLGTQAAPILATEQQ